MGKPFSIFLAVVVFVANTYCACAGIVKADAKKTEVSPAKSHAHCHPAPSEKRGTCHDEQPSDSDHKSHSCGHCTGTVTADTAKAKTTVPALALCPFLFATSSAGKAETPSSFRGIPFENLDLPPPLTPLTLFDLSCSLVI
jgi:hypothetical protein